MAKLALKKPVQVGEGPAIEELIFREEVVAGDMRGLKMRAEWDWDDMLKVAGRLCGQPDVVMNKLSLADLAEVTKLVNSFQ